MKNVIGYRKFFSIFFMSLSVHLTAQWSTNPAVNNAICTATSDQYNPTIASDNSGGAIITWQDQRNGVDYGIYAQRINASGAVQWDSNGVAICTATNNQYNPTIVSDNSGGAIITWQDQRNGVDRDIYAQRINASGAVQWSTDGVAISTATGGQYDPLIVSDNSGGAIITWYDFRNGVDHDIYAQRINASGAVQWTSSGVAICTATNNQNSINIVSDNTGGAIITWLDERIKTNLDIYAQRINASGAVQWTSNGDAICTATGDQYNPTIARDNSGGAIITWYDGRNGVDNDIYAQRINASGSVQWTSSGVAICTATNNQYSPTIVSDNSGGAIITWYDGRSGADQDIYAQRINASGAVQLSTDGVAISTAANNQYSPLIVSDNSGGAIITWYDFRNGVDYDIYAQRINGSGVVQLDSNGVAISTATNNQNAINIVSDNTGGAIITWADERIITNSDIYAQKIITSVGPPTLLTYNKYIHTLHWKNPASSPNKLIIAKKVRFTPGASWEVIDEDSTGVLTVTDTTWTIRTSGYNDYKVGAVYSSGDTMYSVPVVVPRGYVLRKIENDSVVAYNIFAHSFRQITNTSNDVWPISYWAKFNYQNTTLYDPVYFSGTDPELLPDLFPNWLLAAEIEGYDKSFVHYPDKVNGGSVAGWRYLARSHNGSCFGFSTASIFDFYRETGFYDKFNFFRTLLPANVLASDSVIHMLSYLQSYQSFGKYNTSIAQTSDDLTINHVLPELEQYFRNYNNKFYAYLSIGETELCHAIVPYAIEKVNDDLSYIYVYDSNQPSLDDLRIEVQKSTNKWKHSYFTKNKFITGKITLKTGIEKILLPNANTLAAQTLQKVQNQTTLQVVMGSSASSYVIQNGDTITGFNAIDSTIINPAMAIILETDGVLRAPVFYNLPSGNYSVLFKDFGENQTGASMFINNGEGSSLGVHRNDLPSPDDQDIVQIGDNTLSFINHDAVSKKLTLQQSIEKPNNNKSNLKYFEASNITVSSSDSIRIAVAAGDNISLVNYGGASTFNLLFTYTDSVGSGTFKNTEVMFPSNSALTIATDWKDNDSSAFVIAIDNGNDGVIDDSISVKNEVTGVEDGQKVPISPNDFYLGQNYPNPFNPTTTIQFSLPVRQAGIPNTHFVTLKVYDMLGRKVAELVNEVKEAGYYSVTFDASKLSSGIYFYTIHAGNFVQTKKMLLVK